MKVLYISGYERSGSTIFHNVVGQSPGLCACGEIRQIWHRALLQERPCGCGVEPLAECPFWRRVLESAYGDIDNVLPKKWYKYRKRTRNRHFPLIFLPGGEAFLNKWLGDYHGVVHDLYKSISRTSSCSVVVDSSKSPTHAWLLSNISGVDVYVLHLVRDPRGVGYSILKRKRKGHPDYQKYSLHRSSVEWCILNYFSESLKKVGVDYKRVKYESFIQDPGEVVSKIIEWITRDEVIVSWIKDNTVSLQDTHTAVGSPHRFTTGSIELREDKRWENFLTKQEIKKVNRWAGCLMQRYCYL